MAHTPISEGLHEFLTKDSKHYHSVAFASPDAVVFAKEVWEAAQRYASEAAIALAAPIDEVSVHPSLQTLYTLSGNRRRSCPECGSFNCNGECYGDDMMGASG